MKKNFRSLSIFLIVLLIFITVPLMAEDIDSIHSNFGNKNNTKTSIEAFTFITNSSVFYQNENKSNYKTFKTTFLSILRVSISELYDPIIVKSHIRVTIDLRKKIRELLTNRFFGSRYTLKSLFI